MGERAVRENLTDEIVRAAIRVVDERVRYAEPVYHDGTEMVFAPRVIFDRLERAVQLYLDIEGRPKLRPEKVSET